MHLGERGGLGASWPMGLQTCDPLSSHTATKKLAVSR